MEEFTVGEAWEHEDIEAVVLRHAGGITKTLVSYASLERLGVPTTEELWGRPNHRQRLPDIKRLVGRRVGVLGHTVKRIDPPFIGGEAG